MKFDYDEKCDLTRITLSKKGDICAKCSPNVRNKCPLLAALVSNIVYPSCQTLELRSCVYYEETRGVKKDDK